jgi:hypothetical protein
MSATNPAPRRSPVLPERIDVEFEYVMQVAFHIDQGAGVLT